MKDPWSVSIVRMITLVQLQERSSHGRTNRSNGARIVRGREGDSLSPEGGWWLDRAVDVKARRRASGPSPKQFDGEGLTQLALGLKIKGPAEGEGGPGS